MKATTLGVLAALTVFTEPYCEAQDFAPIDVVERLVENGPRTSGSRAHRAAEDALIETLQAIGLQGVGRQISAAGSAVNIEGLLVGSGEAEIVLGAHYDSVAGSPGAADNASGCAVLLAALASLSSQPLEHSLRVVFFDGEEEGLVGSRAWVEGLEVGHRDRILAALHVDTVGMAGASRPVILSLRTADGRGRRVTSPDWLVHAVLESGRSIGWPFAFGDPSSSLGMQLALRANRSRYAADSDAFLEAGVPAVVVSDFDLFAPYQDYHRPGDRLENLDAERLQRWASAMSTAVLRLDRLAGRPRWGDEYWVAGRVWIRRDLLWLGFLIWVVLVLRGRPQRWKGASAAERSSSGRRYLPGFCFRAAFLVATIWTPALGAWLFYPLGLLTLSRSRSVVARAVRQLLGLVPALALALFMLFGYTRGVLRSWDVGWLQTVVLCAPIVTFTWLQWSEGAGGGRDVVS